MISKLVHIIAPPLFHDEYNTPNRTIVNAVLMLMMAGLGVSSVVMLLISRQSELTVAVYLSIIAALIPLYLLARRGWVMLVSVLTVVGLWALVTAAHITLGGLAAPSIPAYMMIIVLAALLLGPWGGLSMALINGTVLAALYRLELDGNLPTPMQDPDPLLRVMVTISHYVLVALFLYVATRVISAAYQRASSTTEKLEKTLEDLRATTVSRDYVENIMQSMRNLLIVLDPDGTIRTVNQSALDTLGYSEEELLGKSFNHTILGEDPDPERMSATELFSNRETRNVEQVYYAKDGHEIPVSLSSSVMYDDVGAIQGVVCVAQDETERRRAEKQIRFQAELMENISDAIIATDMQLTISSWNRAASRVYGWAAEDVIGKHLTDVVNPDRSDIESSDFFETSSSWRRELRHQRKDGSTLQILSSISVVTDDNETPTGIVLVNHDITQRKRMEVALERRVEQLALLRHIDKEVGSTLDVEEVLVTALSAASALSGADAGFIMLIREVEGVQLVHTSGRYDGSKGASSVPDDAVGVVGRVIRTEQAAMLYDVTMDEDYVPTLPETRSQMVLPMMSQDSLIAVVNLESTEMGRFSVEVFDFLKILFARVAMAIDNARLYLVARQQVEELRSVYAHVSKLEQIKTDMIRIASHDLRSPIGLIIGYLQILEADTAGRLTPAEQDFLAEISKAIKRMESITNDILSLERIQEVASADFSETVNMIDMAAHVVDAYTSEANIKEQSLQLYMADLDQQVVVEGDRAQLREAMVNLVTNAIKYTPAGGTIRVDLEQHEGRVTFTVKDNGYGIPESQQEKLFQPFSRAKSAETNDIGGTGLGLHLVKNIIERHAGKIIFHSEYKKGSVFGFTLPVLNGNHE